MQPKSEQNELQPGADRFWGEFSRSQAGRSTGGEDRMNGDAGSAEPGESNGAHNDNCLEWCPICRSAELFRNTVSPELRQQADSIQHEAIGVLKAFLDAYAEKSTSGQTGQPADRSDDPGDEAPPDAPRVTDIPLS